MQLPENIAQCVQGMTASEEAIGRSEATVVQYHDAQKTLYLKIQKTHLEFTREQAIIQWLDGQLPVPKIVAQSSENGSDYLLMTAVDGVMAHEVQDEEAMVLALSNGLKQLWQVPVEACPFEHRLADKLEWARVRVAQGLVDVEDWEPETPFDTPEALFEYLFENQPEEMPVFTHGDFCLPNVFVKGEACTGVIDWGRAGIADKWQDIALCVRSMRYNFGDDRLSTRLFEHLGIERDDEKIAYYILLDELF